MMTLGIDPGLTGAAVLCEDGRPVWWGLWVERKRKAGRVWEVCTSEGTDGLSPTRWSAVSMVVESASCWGFDEPPVVLAEQGEWKGRNKTPASIQGFGEGVGMVLAAVEAWVFVPESSVLRMTARQWRAKALGISGRTGRERAEYEAVKVWRRVSEGLPQPPDAQVVHVAEACGMAVAGYRRGRL